LTLALVVLRKRYSLVKDEFLGLTNVITFFNIYLFGYQNFAKAISSQNLNVLGEKSENKIS
jgi:hypothetical protein